MNFSSSSPPPPQFRKFNCLRAVSLLFSSGVGMSVTVLKDVDGREWHVPSTLIDTNGGGNAAATPQGYAAPAARAPGGAPMAQPVGAPHAAAGAPRAGPYPVAGSQSVAMPPSNPFAGAQYAPTAMPPRAAPSAVPVAAPIAAAAAVPFFSLPFLSAPPPIRFGAYNYGPNQSAYPPLQPPEPVDEPPLPLWLKILVTPFALIYLAIKWLLYFIIVFIPEFIIVWIPMGIARGCAPIWPAIEGCVNECCRGMHMACLACCSVARQVERASGARR
jgi:hypothetical protein